jgi:hypothetical protein
MNRSMITLSPNIHDLTWALRSGHEVVVETKDGPIRLVVDAIRRFPQGCFQYEGDTPDGKHYACQVCLDQHKSHYGTGEIWLLDD